MEYEIRTIIFIDILGFKHLVRNTKDLSVISDALHNLQQIKGRKEKPFIKEVAGSEDRYIKSLQVGMFSDSIILSCHPQDDYYLFLDAMDIQLKLMSTGIFVRGCASRGQLIHRDNYIFGPALIKAYTGETSMAKYPRIIIDETVLYEGTLFCKDFDGIVFLDFFRHLNDKHWNENLDLDSTVRSIYNYTKEKIGTYDDLNVKSKFEWLKGLIEEVFYINDNKYTYFRFTNTTYDRNTAFSLTRNRLMKELKEKADH